MTADTGNLCGILIGIEGCAPGKSSIFGGSHGASAVSQDYSAFGKKKWRFYRQGGQEVPADIGGIHVVVNEELFEDFKNVTRRIPLSKPSFHRDGYKPSPDMSTEREFFRQILQSSDGECEQLLKELVEPPYHRPMWRGQGMLFDQSVAVRIHKELSNSRSNLSTTGGVNVDKINAKRRGNRLRTGIEGKGRRLFKKQQGSNVPPETAEQPSSGSKVGPSGELLSGVCEDSAQRREDEARFENSQVAFWKAGDGSHQDQDNHIDASPVKGTRSVDEAHSLPGSPSASTAMDEELALFDFSAEVFYI